MLRCIQLTPSHLCEDVSYFCPDSFAVRTVYLCSLPLLPSAFLLLEACFLCILFIFLLLKKGDRILSVKWKNKCHARSKGGAALPKSILTSVWFILGPCFDALFQESHMWQWKKKCKWKEKIIYIYLYIYICVLCHFIPSPTLFFVFICSFLWCTMQTIPYIKRALSLSYLSSCFRYFCKLCRAWIINH